MRNDAGQTPPAHDFATKLAEGEAWGQVLDCYFRRWYHIERVRAGDDRAGMDRLFRRLQAGDAGPTRVEYKADSVAGQSGHAFIETRSVDDDALGWVVTSQADEIIYYVPPLARAYRLPTSKLRAAGLDWMDRFGQRFAVNSRYMTHGLRVPLQVLASVADSVLEVPPTLDPAGSVIIEEWVGDHWEQPPFAKFVGGLAWRNALDRLAYATRLWPSKRYRVQPPVWREA